MSDIKRVSLTPTLSLTAYSIGDVVGGLLDFGVVGQEAAGNIFGKSVTAKLQQIKICDDANQKEPFVLYLFASQPATIANDAAFALAFADIKKIIGKVSIAADQYITVGADAIAYVQVTPDMYFEFNANKHLYGYLVAVDTPDYAAATDLFIELTFLTE